RLVLVLEANLGCELDPRGAGAGDDDVRRPTDALGSAVQRLDALLVRAGRLPGHVGVGGAGSRREDEVVIAERPGLRGGGLYLDGPGVLVHLGRGADDELDAAGGVLGQAGLDWLEEFLILDEAWYDGSHG